MKKLIKLLIFLAPFSLCAQSVSLSINGCYGIGGPTPEKMLDLSRYVVVWDVWSFVSVPCPDVGKLNEYTGQGQSFGMVCAVLHGNWIVDRNRKKDFNEKEKAIKFVENAPDNNPWLELRDFKLMQISGVDTTITKMPPRDKE